MTKENYIIGRLKLWKTMFPELHLKYAYDRNSEYNIIEVQPREIYENEKYAKEELKLWTDFCNIFPDDDLLIAEPNICNDMSNLIYEI